MNFLATNALRYSTKLALVLTVAFIVGNSITSFLYALAGGIGGAAGALRQRKIPGWPHGPETAPWRDPSWRKLAMQYLVQNSPKDTLPMSGKAFEMQRSSFARLESPFREQAELDLLNQRTVSLLMISFGVIGTPSSIVKCSRTRLKTQLRGCPGVCAEVCSLPLFIYGLA